jgi:hypothetical protein
MTTKQLEAALSMAVNDQRSMIDEDIMQFDGFGLKNFEPVTCTLRQLAALVRWQCVRYNGTVDSDALQEVAESGRRAFTVLEDPVAQLRELLAAA